MHEQNFNHTELSERREITCPFCSKAGEKVLFSAPAKNENNGENREYTLARCRGCRLIYITNPLPVTQTNEMNGQREDTRGFFKKIWQKKWNIIRSRFIASEIPAGNVLQIECGKGALLALLKEQGFTVIGIDTNPDFIHAEDKAVTETYLFDFLNFFHYDNEFDAILFMDSLRFSPDPEKEIEKAIRLLNEDGAIFIEERIFNTRISNGFNAHYSEYDYPESVYYYNPYTLKKILRDKGYKLKKWIKYSPGGYFDFLKSFSAFLKNKWKLKNIILQLPLLIPAFVFSPVINGFFFGSNYLRYGVFGNRFLGVFVQPKNR